MVTISFVPRVPCCARHADKDGPDGGVHGPYGRDEAEPHADWGDGQRDGVDRAGRVLVDDVPVAGASQRGRTSTAPEMWTGLFFALMLALLTAYSYSELARIYPDAGTGSSYYFAEAALLTKENPKHRSCARFAKLSIGWISHLYYWIYPGIMVAFTATLFGYIYASVFNHQLSYLPLAASSRSCSR